MWKRAESSCIATRIFDANFQLSLSLLWWSQHFFCEWNWVVCSLIFRPSHYLCVDKLYVFQVSEFPSSNTNYKLYKPTSRGFKNSAIGKFCNLIWERGGNVGLLCVCSTSVCSTLSANQFTTSGRVNITQWYVHFPYCQLLPCQWGPPRICFLTPSSASHRPGWTYALVLSAVLYCLWCSAWILQCIHDCLLFNVKTLKAVIRLDTVCYVWYVYTWGLYKNAEPSLFVYNIMHKGKTFEGESFHEFCGFMDTCESFLRKIWECGVLGHGKSEQSAKIFSLESFPLYVMHKVD